MYFNRVRFCNSNFKPNKSCKEEKMVPVTLHSNLDHARQLFRPRSSNNRQISKMRGSRLFLPDCMTKHKQSLRNEFTGTVFEPLKMLTS